MEAEVFDDVDDGLNWAKDGMARPSQSYQFTPNTILLSCKFQGYESECSSRHWKVLSLVSCQMR